MEIFVSDEKETLQVGQRLSHGVHNGGIIYLKGDTGAGKSTLVRGILTGLGLMITKSRSNSSYVQTFENNGLTIHCLDLYSLTNPDDPRFSIACNRLSEAGTLRIVESPERARGELPEPDLVLKFRPGLKGRTIVIDALTERGANIAHHISVRH